MRNLLVNKPRKRYLFNKKYINYRSRNAILLPRKSVNKIGLKNAMVLL